jgi:hypothetical protein
MGNPVRHVVSVTFAYDGVKRLVDNIDFDPKNRHMIGFEMRRAGKFSYRIKRFDIAKITDLKFVSPPHRSGPKIGRPTTS